MAFEATDKNDVLPLIGFVDTGEADEANEWPVSAAALPTGWYVVFFNDFLFTTPERLSQFSAGGAVIACQIEEHIMASACYFYRSGRHVWTVTHDSTNGCYDLSVDGDPPDPFRTLRDGLLKQQREAGGDKASIDFVFDIPVELASALCGYRHDRWKFDWGEPMFSRLKSSKI
jgi:hypothetical protein